MCVCVCGLFFSLSLHPPPHIFFSSPSVFLGKSKLEHDEKIVGQDKAKLCKMKSRNKQTIRKPSVITEQNNSKLKESTHSERNEPKKAL